MATVGVKGLIGRSNAGWGGLGRSTSVDEWSDFTERNLTSAEKQRRNSVRLRAVADGVLQTSCNDINRQRDSADLAIEMRVNEIRDAKEKLEQHLNKVLDLQWTACLECVKGGTR